jgi:hypothetical protein
LLEPLAVPFERRRSRFRRNVRMVADEELDLRGHVLREPRRSVDRRVCACGRVYDD